MDSSDKIIITPESDSFSVYIKKIWQHRNLILVFAKRDLKIKYAQTLLGLAWTLLQPLTAVLIFTIFFSVLLNFETEYPYALYVLSGILIWNFFNYIFTHASSGLTDNQDLIRKMYFPKIIIPISKVLLAFVEFTITLVLLLLIMFLLKVDFQWTILLSPLVLIPVILFSLGLALILSALTIKNRDLFHIMPFLVNFGIWLTPVFYPLSIIPEQYKQFIYLNPMATTIQLFRWSFFGEETFSFFMIFGIVICFLFFITGFLFFKNAEDKIIDSL